jgi:hypothetical protein
MASNKRAGTHQKTSSIVRLPNQSLLGDHRANVRQSNQMANASRNPNIIELILHEDKLKFKFPRPPRGTAIKPTKRSNIEKSSDLDVESVCLDDAQSARSQDSSEELDDQQGQGGIPIPGQGRCLRRTWADEMDDEAVLEELTASEGGFHRSWHQSQQGPWNLIRQFSPKGGDERRVS